jgi:1,4-alpha-glucan branching enzyme
MRKGYLALVLHAHLPFVRHPEYPDFLEEDWLFEAITETYLPLWQVFEGLIRDGVPFRLTMSLTPCLSGSRDRTLETRNRPHTVATGDESSGQDLSLPLFGVP